MVILSNSLLFFGVRTWQSPSHGVLYGSVGAGSMFFLMCFVLSKKFNGEHDEKKCPLDYPKWSW